MDSYARARYLVRFTVPDGGAPRAARVVVEFGKKVERGESADS
jgi:hypothetical protein